MKSLVFVLLLGICGCAHVTGELPQPTAITLQPMRGLQVGAAKIDITPTPGYPIGHDDLAGPITCGYWSRLFARAVYIQDIDGHGVMLVSCDLWAVDASLRARVINHLSEEPDTRQIGLDQLLLTATHAQHTPANYFGTSLYNNYGNREAGYDRNLADFLSVRIAKACQVAYRARQPATLRYTRRFLATYPLQSGPQPAGTPASVLIRNTNAAAFAADRDANERIAENERVGGDFAALVKQYSKNEALAVDRSISTLTATSARDGKMIAIAAFVAVRPDSLPEQLPLYSGELLGVTAALCEQEFPSERDSPDNGEPTNDAVVAIFNGPEADAAIDSDNRGRETTLRYAAALKQAIMACSAMSQGVFADSAHVSWKISYRTTVAPLECVNVEGHCTASEPRLRFRKPPRTAMVLPWLTYPVNVPLTIYTIGPICVATVPGEFSSMMGRRIRTELANKLPHTSASNDVTSTPPIILLGFANEFVSSFVTPEEFQTDPDALPARLTLYGPYSGAAVKMMLGQLASSFALPPPPQTSTKYDFWPGLERHFPTPYFRRIAPPGRMGSVLEGIMESKPSRFRCFEWLDAIPDGKERVGVFHTTPRVCIESNPLGKWARLQEPDGTTEDDAGLNFVTVCSLIDDYKVLWRCYWIVPDNLPSSLPPKPQRIYRFRVTPASGTHVIYSEPFPLFQTTSSGQKCVPVTKQGEHD